jgi:hypothetical protein
MFYLEESRNKKKKDKTKKRFIIYLDVLPSKIGYCHRFEREK